MKAVASRATSAATDGSSRCSIWNTISTCWSAKPGALIGSRPLAAWRERGLWPQNYDRLLDALISRHGKQSGTRQMIQVLSLIKRHGHQRVRSGGGRSIVALGCPMPRRSGIWWKPSDLTHARSAIIELGALARFEAPLPVITDYDGLLEPGGGAMNAQAAVLETASHSAAVQGITPADGRGASAANSPSRRCANAARTWASSKRCSKPNSRNVKQRLVERRIREAHLPRMKTLEEFDFSRNPEGLGATDSRTRPRRLHRPG